MGICPQCGKENGYGTNTVCWECTCENSDRARAEAFFNPKYPYDYWVSRFIDKDHVWIKTDNGTFAAALAGKIDKPITEEEARNYFRLNEFEPNLNYLMELQREKSRHRRKR